MCVLLLQTSLHYRQNAIKLKATYEILSSLFGLCKKYLCDWYFELFPGSHVKIIRLTLSLGYFKICILNVGVVYMKLRKYSNTGGVVGRRTRALERLQKVKKPNEKQLKDIEILEKRIKEITLK